MSDNPFSEHEDSDRTVIRPVPGGRRTACDAGGTPAHPPTLRRRRAPPRRSSGEGAETISFGLSPLIEAAAPLLQLLGRLRNTYSQPDPGDLRERAIQQIRTFEQAARDAGVPLDQLRPAHYALCASLDDVVLNTPWGSSGPGRRARWSRPSTRRCAAASASSTCSRSFGRTPARSCRCWS